jgi:hypothetical protein
MSLNERKNAFVSRAREGRRGAPAAPVRLAARRSRPHGRAQGGSPHCFLCALSAMWSRRGAARAGVR